MYFPYSSRTASPSSAPNAEVLIGLMKQLVPSAAPSPHRVAWRVRTFEDIPSPDCSVGLD